MNELGIPVSMPSVSSSWTPTSEPLHTASSSYIPESAPVQSHFTEMPADFAFQFPQFDHLDQLEISPEMFEAVSSLEPISVRVGALDEFNSQAL